MLAVSQRFMILHLNADISDRGLVLLTHISGLIDSAINPYNILI